MAPLSPTAKHAHHIAAMSVGAILSPTHANHIRPVVQAGGGAAKSDIPRRLMALLDGVREHLLRVYDSLRGSEPHLTKEQFSQWMKTVQFQPLEPSKETYKFEQFLEEAFHTGVLEALAPVDAEKKDMSKPLSHYFISSSHNTYLSGNQILSKSTTEAYEKVLIRGCRCIEIDVHNGESQDDRSTSSSMPSSPTPEHKRHLSGSTLSSFAAAAKERVEEKVEAAFKKYSGKKKVDTQERSLTMDSLSLGNSIERPPSTRSVRSGEPIVLHGWTLTTPIGFRDVCKAIRGAAFISSDLPVIVSLEVHADLEQQEIMVQIMKEEWSSLLVDAAHEACDPEERLPRLEEMRKKILIKVKKVTNDPSAPNSLSPVVTHQDPDSGLSGSEDERSSSKAKKPKIAESLSNLAIYTHSERFVSFEAKSAKKPSHIYSIGESQIADLHETNQQIMFNHNRDYFMRAYPAGFRIDSSNLDPSEFWRKGVQMVALNWQKIDEGMMLNEGMFADEKGWVLKPPGYHNDINEPIDYKTLNLKITVLAAQHIPIPAGTTAGKFSPYIRCELHVEKQEKRTEQDEELTEEASRAKDGEFKRKTPYGKGDSPNFGIGGSVMEFKGITKVVQWLSFVRFKVEDFSYTKDALAAWACIRLDRLQQGYRFVHLIDAKGMETPGLLLVKIEKGVK